MRGKWLKQCSEPEYLISSELNQQVLVQISVILWVGVEWTLLSDIRPAFSSFCVPVRLLLDYSHWLLHSRDYHKEPKGWGVSESLGIVTEWVTDWISLMGFKSEIPLWYLGVLLELIFSSLFRGKKYSVSESTYYVLNTSAVYFSSFNFIVFGDESLL